MKNLNKKIGVVALSGLMLVGGGLSSSVLAYEYKPQVSEFVSKWPLKERDFDDPQYKDINKEDYDFILLHENQRYMKDIKVIEGPRKFGQGNYDLEFKNVHDFIFFLRIMKDYKEGIYKVNVRGVGYKIKIGKYNW